MSAAVASERPAGRYDSAARRVLKRSGRETGGWAYIPAEVLEAAGVDPAAPELFYRVWPGIRGGLRMRIYRSK